MESIIFYLLIFILGTVFGSFTTLAVYRIPLHQDITHERSYCPKCNHKLSFWDMIPVWSYIFLGGKCRYCKSKIRPRYLILEIITGITFVLLAMSINMNFLNPQMDKLVYLVATILYLVGLIIIAGIDKEKFTISKSVLLYQIFVVSAYMIYLYIVEGANIHRYVIYLFVMLVLLLINTIYYKKKLKDFYALDLFILSSLMAAFTYEWCFFFTAVMTLLEIAIHLTIIRFKNRKIRYVKKISKGQKVDVPVGYYLCCSNIILLILINFIAIGGWM